MVSTTIQKHIEKEIRDFVEVLREENLPIDSVYLFGSYARGNPRKWSDIDVCVISPQFKDSFDATQYLWQKRRKHSTPVIEPIGMSAEDFAEDTTLTREIKRHGIEVPLLRGSDFQTTE